MGRRRKGFLSKLIGKGYKALSLANTINVVLSGDPVRISRHMTRKKTVALGSKLVPGKK